jgi:predicted nucleotidyltransferase
VVSLTELQYRGLVDVAEPGRALAPGLTLPVLRALSRRSGPATASQIWVAARDGTLAGVQRACERLVEHGLVEAAEIAGRTVYSLNDAHLLHDALVALLKVDGALLRRLRDAVRQWDVQPVSAALFGSAARGDGGTGSDIDLLLVRPRLAAGERLIWARQVRSLAQDVLRWTGNRLQVVDRSTTEVRRLARAGDAMVASWLADARPVTGVELHDLLGVA